MTNSVKFISICSGIEAASVAFEPLGWEAAAFSEIEPFPCAVLAHHYPDVPNLGDMTKFDTWPEEIFLEADLIVGGPPCQAFSVAGNRAGLADDRGNLTLVYVELINHADLIRKKHGKEPVIAFYENVPGIFSDKTNAYGCLLGALAGEDGALLAPGGKWTDAGCVSGPQRAMAWRLFDAQYHALAQRRRRVFLVASARDGFDPSEILFEREGVRRDLAPSREAGKEVAGTIAARFGISRNNHEECVATAARNHSHWDGDYPHPTLNQSAKGSGGVGSSNQEIFSQRGAYLAPTVIGNVEGGAATTLSSREYKGLSCGRDGMTSAAVVYEAQPIPIHDQATRFAGKRGENQDGKGNGLGIGEPGAPMNTLTKGDRHAVAYELVYASQGSMIGRNDHAGPQGNGINEDVCFTQNTTDRHAVAYEAQPIPFDTTQITSPSNYSKPQAGDPCHPLAAGAHPPAIAQPMVLMDQGGSVMNVMEDGTVGTLRRETHGHEPSVLTNMAVRRLTPVECERLQGFPDDYTNIPWRKQPTSPDGPRYKALGNSWAVPNVRWIGARIDNYLKQLSGEQK